MPDSSQFVDIGVARVDVGRHDRCGFPEVIFGPGKTPGDMVAIARKIMEHHGVLLATRVDAAQTAAMSEAFRSLIVGVGICSVNTSVAISLRTSACTPI